MDNEEHAVKAEDGVKARDSSAADRRRRARRLVTRPNVAIPLIVSAAGATTSSLGISALRADPTHPLGVMLGVARGIRSDEWLTEVPIELAVVTHGAPVISPLTHQPDLIYQISSEGWPRRSCSSRATC